MEVGQRTPCKSIWGRMERYVTVFLTGPALFLLLLRIRSSVTVVCIPFVAHSLPSILTLYFSTRPSLFFVYAFVYYVISICCFWHTCHLWPASCGGLHCVHQKSLYFSCIVIQVMKYRYILPPLVLPSACWRCCNSAKRCLADLLVYS